MVLPGIKPSGELQADSFAPFGSFQHRPQSRRHCNQRPLLRDPSFNGAASAPMCEDHTRARLWRFLASRSRFPGFVVRRNVTGCYLVCLLVNRTSFQMCQHHKNDSNKKRPLPSRRLIRVRSNPRLEGIGLYPLRFCGDQTASPILRLWWRMSTLSPAWRRHPVRAKRPMHQSVSFPVQLTICAE